MRLKYVTIIHANTTGTAVAERWKNQYLRNGTWTDTDKGNSILIYNKLLALDTEDKIEKIDEIIGNKSWTHITCSGCYESILEAVSFQESEIILCKTCIKEANKIVKKIV